MLKRQKSFSRKGDESHLSASLELDLLSHESAAADSLRRSIVKKWKCQTKETDALALHKFLECNEKCKGFVLTPASLFDELVIGEVKSILDDWFTSPGDGALQAFGSGDLADRLMPGPGASVGANGEDFYTKLFSSTLTSTTEVLLKLYRSYISASPTWRSAELLRFEMYGDRIVQGSLLSFVPKNRDISRTICTEPSVNMLFQKAIGSVFTDILWKRVGIDLSKQPDVNRELCRLGSMDQSPNGFCTIDLSSASDSISTSVVKSVFPPFVVDWLMRTRSPVTILPDGTQVELGMISSMGNGYTFPLQTMLFSSIVKAVYKLTESRLRTNGRPNFGVFGDDIIVTKRNYDLVVRALNLFGFTVNTEKSYSEGLFRESCGADFYNGTNIRGVYIRSLDTEAQVYSGINRLVRWSLTHGIMLPNTIEYLYSLLRRKLFIPFREDDSSGLKVKEAFLPESPHYSLSPTGSRRYRALVPVGRSFSAIDLQTASKQMGPKGISFNPSGLLVAFVGGFVRNGRISQRLQDVRSYNLRSRTVPYWDWDPLRPAGLADQAGWKAGLEVYSYLLTS